MSLPPGLTRRLLRLGAAGAVGPGPGRCAARGAAPGLLHAYYEREDAKAPGPQLPALAQALLVTTDELLGVKRLPDVPRPRTARS